MAATDLNIENVLNALREQPDLQVAIMEATTNYTIDLNTRYTSPFREDNNPACFFKWENGLLKFKDFAAHFSLSGSVLDTIRLSSGKSMSEVLKYVNIKYNLCLGYDPDLDVSIRTILPINKYIAPPPSVSAVIRYESYHTASAFDYFYEYGITDALLTKYSVKACKTVWVQSSKGTIETFHWQNTCPLFLYCWRVNGRLLDKFKMYRPLAQKAGKWSCNTNLIDDVGLEENRNKKEKEKEKIEVDFITSSRKDRMVLELAGYTSVCALNEMAVIDTNQYSAKYTFMDNDRAGIAAAAKYDLPSIVVPNQFTQSDITSQIKDPADYAKVFGITALQTLIKEQITHYEEVD